MHLSTRLQRATEGEIVILQLMYVSPMLPMGTRGGLFADESLFTDKSVLSKLGRFAAELTLKECALCGGETRSPFPNRAGEWFCSRSHREQSNRQRDAFLRSQEVLRS